MEPAALAYLVINEVAGFAGFAIAVLVLSPRPVRALNLVLAAYIVAGSANLITQGLKFADLSPFLAANDRLYIGFTADIAPVLYIAFFPLAIASPIARALRHPAIFWTSIAVVVGAIVTFVVAPQMWGAVTSTGAYHADGPISAFTRTRIIYLALAAALISTAASLDALRRAAPGTLARRRARAYVAAFVVNDVSLVVGYGPDLFDRSVRDLLIVGVAPLAFLVFLAMLTRSLLRDQLFDFDLKLKLNVKRGTIAAVFLAVFFVVAQVAQNFLSSYGYVVGGIAAGLLLFALAPLQRAAERVASAAVPGAVDSPEYRLVKKRDVYRAAVEGALEDGVVTDKERTVLARLADQLGLSVSETLDIEREARSVAPRDGRAA